MVLGSRINKSNQKTAMAYKSHSRAIARPLLVISIFALFFIFYVNFNLSSYNLANSIFDQDQSNVQLTLVDAANHHQPISEEAIDNVNEILDESKVAFANDFPETSVRHYPSNVTQLCPLISPKLGK